MTQGHLKLFGVNNVTNNVGDIVIHFQDNHKKKEKCELCDFEAATHDEITDHRIETHEDFGLLIKLSSQQKLMTQNFDIFRDEMSDIVKELIATQNAIKQEMFIMRQSQVSEKKIIQVEKSLELVSSLLVKDAEERQVKVSPPKSPNVPQPKATEQTIKANEKHSGQNQSSSTQEVSPSVERVPEQRRPKTLYIGDSISANINFNAIKKGINSEIVTAKAYSSVNDTVSNAAKSAARFPEANFTAVIPAKLATESFDNLIVQAGSVDITNLKTKVEPTKHFEYFRQEAVVSAKNLFSACENALKQNPNLKKVVVMKQTPRYDTLEADPSSLKPILSQLFNNSLTESWMTSKLKYRIFVGSHNIDCTGSIREARYRSTKTGFYDGLHLYGSSGRKAYTNSVMSILKSAGLVDPMFDHTNCPQTTYQAKQRGFVRNQSWQYDVDVRKAGFGKKAQFNQRYEVPTQNRFSGLSDNFQGNC